MNYDIIEKLKKEIEGFKDDPRFEDVGSVVEAGDGIAKISGLRKALSQELLSIETHAGEVFAVAFNLEENFIGAVILGDASSVRVGDRVKRSGRVLSIRIGKEVIGRVVSPLRAPPDAKSGLFES